MQARPVPLPPHRRPARPALAFEARRASGTSRVGTRVRVHSTALPQGRGRRGRRFGRTEKTAPAGCAGIRRPKCSPARRPRVGRPGSRAGRRGPGRGGGPPARGPSLASVLEGHRQRGLRLGHVHDRKISCILRSSIEERSQLCAGAALGLGYPPKVCKYGSMRALWP